MNDVLRSLVWFDTTEEPEAKKNIAKMRLDRFLSMKAPQRLMADYILNFYVRYSTAPEWKTVRDHAEGTQDPEVVKVVEGVELSAFYKGNDFEEMVEREVRSQGLTELTATCKEAISLVASGKKNLSEGIGHLFSTVKVPPTKESDKLPANMKKAAPVLDQLYQTRKNNPRHSYGIMTGYGMIDQCTAGIKKKQLYLHAAFAGHLKSTMMLNMMMNAIEMGWNGLYFTAEMPADDMMLKLAAIHSANKKFNGIHRPLVAFRLLLGQLNFEEEKFYKEVMDDLVNNPDHGSIRVVDSGEFTTLGSIMQRTNREHMEEEVDEVWIDYLTRLPIDAKYAKMMIREARNETIVDAKQFAMSFDGGRGLAVCSGFQTNRESFKKAKENDGKYDKTCLADYNAAEKEADVITYTWFGDDEKKNSEPKGGVLKSRWGEEKADVFSFFIERDSRRVFDMTAGLRISATPTQAAGGLTSDVEI